jgi:hypothetical protein
MQKEDENYQRYSLRPTGKSEKPPKGMSTMQRLNAMFADYKQPTAPEENKKSSVSIYSQSTATASYKPGKEQYMNLSKQQVQTLPVKKEQMFVVGTELFFNKALEGTKTLLVNNISERIFEPPINMTITYLAITGSTLHQNDFAYTAQTKLHWTEQELQYHSKSVASEYGFTLFYVEDDNKIFVQGYDTCKIINKAEFLDILDKLDYQKNALKEIRLLSSSEYIETLKAESQAFYNFKLVQKNAPEGHFSKTTILNPIAEPRLNSGLQNGPRLKLAMPKAYEADNNASKAILPWLAAMHNQCIRISCSDDGAAKALIKFIKGEFPMTAYWTEIILQSLRDQQKRFEALSKYKELHWYDYLAPTFTIRREEYSFVEAGNTIPYDPTVQNNLRNIDQSNCGIFDTELFNSTRFGIALLYLPTKLQQKCNLTLIFQLFFNNLMHTQYSHKYEIVPEELSFVKTDNPCSTFMQYIQKYPNQIKERLVRNAEDRYDLLWEYLRKVVILTGKQRDLHLGNDTLNTYRQKINELKQKIVDKKHELQKCAVSNHNYSIIVATHKEIVELQETLKVLSTKFDQNKKTDLELRIKKEKIELKKLQQDYMTNLREIQKLEKLIDNLKEGLKPFEKQSKIEEDLAKKQQELQTLQEQPNNKFHLTKYKEEEIENLENQLEVLEKQLETDKVRYALQLIKEKHDTLVIQNLQINFYYLMWNYMNDNHCIIFAQHAMVMKEQAHYLKLKQVNAEIIEDFDRVVKTMNLDPKIKAEYNSLRQYLINQMPEIEGAYITMFDKFLHDDMDNKEKIKNLKRVVKGFENTINNRRLNKKATYSNSHLDHYESKKRPNIIRPMGM